MRSSFRPEPTDSARFVREAVVVPDANVLLGLYRLSADAREKTLAALESVGDRLWLPHHVGSEFYGNLDAARNALPVAYAETLKVIDGLAKVPASAFQTGKRFEDSRDAVAKVLATGAQAMRAEIEVLQRDDTSIVSADDDSVLERIENMFEGKVGAPTPAATVLARVAEFTEHRAPAQMPPGYDDAARKRDAPLRGAGDYLWWCELLDMAASDARPVLVVTDDVKSDWWVRRGGRTVGPRPELAREFAERSKAGYHQMTLSNFVEVATAEFASGTAAEAVREIEEIATEAADSRTSPTLRWLLERGYPTSLSSASRTALAQQQLFGSITGAPIGDPPEYLFARDFERYGLGDKPWAMSAAEALGSGPRYDALAQIVAHADGQDRAWANAASALGASRYDSISAAVDQAFRSSANGPRSGSAGVQAAAEALAAKSAIPEGDTAIRPDVEGPDDEREDDT